MKPGYKQTEVGVIPEDWKVKSIADIMTLKHGFAFSSVYFSKSGPIVLTPGNFRLEGGLYFEERNTKRYSGSYSAAMTFRKGDLLIVMTDLTPDCNLLGKPAFVESDEVILHNQRIGLAQLNDQSTCLKLLYYLLLSRPYLYRIKEQATGSTVRHTSNKSIYSVKLAYPPLPEQRAIAEALSDVDGLLGGLDRLIAKKRDLKQAAMQQLLTGQTRLPGFHGEWEVKTLGKLGNISGAGVDKKIRPGEPLVRLVNYMDVYRSNLISSVDLDHVVSASPDQASRCAVRRGDIFFTPSSEMPFDIAASAVATEDIPDACYSYHVVRLRLEEDWDLNFRAYAFKTQNFLDQAARTCEGSGVRYVISQSKFRQLTVRYPTSKTEQTAIAEILSDMDAELTALEQRREKTLALKQAMMQELLTGKTRLV